MKRIILMLLVLPFMAAAQKSYTISGTLSELKVPAKAYLTLVKNGAWKEVDSVEINNGKFQFTGSLPEPEQALIGVRRIGIPELRSSRDYTALFIENAKISIAGTDSIKKATITGSQASREDHELEAKTGPLVKQISKINDRFSKYNKNSANETPEARKVAGDSLRMLIAAIKDTKRKFVESHPNSFMGLYVYNLNILDSYFDPAKEEPLFNRFSAALKSSPLGKRTFQKLEIGKRRMAGAKATDFTQNDLNDEAFTLSSLRGKYVLVDFWASWCVPCRAENPNVLKAYNELKAKNFEIVGVSLDQSKAAWADAVKKDGLPWIHVSDLKGWKNEVAVMYGINSVPQNLLIDPQGMIIAKNLRGEALTEKLRQLVK